MYKIYMAGPIFQCDDGEAKDWRQYLINTYGQARLYRQFFFIDPMRRDYRGKENESVNRIVQMDKLDILRSFALIVYYTKPSVGTSMEIMFAWMKDIPVIVVTQEEKVSPWLTYHATAIVNSFDQAIDEIRSML